MFHLCSTHCFGFKSESRSPVPFSCTAAIHRSGQFLLSQVGSQNLVCSELVIVAFRLYVYMTFYISNLQHQIRCIYTLQVSPFHEPLLAHRKRKKSGACARVFYVREQSSFYSILPTEPSIKIQWPNTLIIQNHTPLQRLPTRSKRVPEKMKAHNAKSKRKIKQLQARD